MTENNFCNIINLIQKDCFVLIVELSLLEHLIISYLKRYMHR